MMRLIQVASQDATSMLWITSPKTGIVFWNFWLVKSGSKYSMSYMRVIFHFMKKNYFVIILIFHYSYGYFQVYIETIDAQTIHHCNTYLPGEWRVRNGNCRENLWPQRFGSGYGTSEATENICGRNERRSYWIRNSARFSKLYDRKKLIF